MHYWELIEATGPLEKARKDREKRKREQEQKVKANQKLASGRAASNNAMRQCQRDQQAAAKTQSHEGGSDALRKFERQRQAAHAQTRTAQNRLSTK